MKQVGFYNFTFVHEKFDYFLFYSQCKYGLLYYTNIIPFYILEEGQLVRVDEYWQHVFDIKNAAGNEKFRHLTKLVKTCLSIHHGNADVERSLSDNKNLVTKERTQLANETIIGLRRSKQYAQNAGGTHLALYLRKMINKVKDAHLNHTIRDRQRKEEKERERKLIQQKKEDEARKKKEIEEKLSKHHEKEKELLNEEKKVSEEISIAHTMISEGNKRLAVARSNKDMNEIATASALIDSAQKRIDTVQKSVLNVQECHKKLLGKRKKYEDLYKESVKKCK